MIIYRPIRFSLFESMALAKEFETIQEMKEYIVKEHTWEEVGPAFEIDDIVIGNESIKDDRIGWNNVCYVCVKRYLSEDYIEKYGVAQCIGMCATDYNREESLKWITRN